MHWFFWYCQRSMMINEIRSINGPMMNLAIPFNSVYLLLVMYFPLFSPVWSLWNLQLQHMKNLQLSSKKPNRQIHGCITHWRLLNTKITHLTQKCLSLRLAEDRVYCSKWFLLLILFLKYVLLTTGLDFWPCMSIPKRDKNGSTMCGQLTKLGWSYWRWTS